VVHSAWPSQAMWGTHAPTFNKWHKEEEEEEEDGTAHVGTWRNVRVGLTSLVACINDKFRDIRERNVIMRSEI
jgi:hypothetical protein